MAALRRGAARHGAAVAVDMPGSLPIPMALGRSGCRSYQGTVPGFRQPLVTSTCLLTLPPNPSLTVTVKLSVRSPAAVGV
jgi:hypothetical protein